MKKVGAIICIGFMLFGISVESHAENTNKIIETQEIEEIDYLTKEDFEQLYTCKQDIRKSDDSIVELSYDDALLLMQVARCEGGHSLEGQLWVMRTIMNRYDNEWGKDLWEILTQENQFNVVLDGTYLNANVNADTHIALAMLESGWNDTKGALYWEATTNSPYSWHKQNLSYIDTIKGNIYYK